MEYSHVYKHGRQPTLPDCSSAYFSYGGHRLKADTFDIVVCDLFIGLSGPATRLDSSRHAPRHAPEPRPAPRPTGNARRQLLRGHQAPPYPSYVIPVPSTHPAQHPEAIRTPGRYDTAYPGPRSPPRRASYPRRHCYRSRVGHAPAARHRNPRYAHDTPPRHEFAIAVIIDLLRVITLLLATKVSVPLKPLQVGTMYNA